MRLHPPLCFNHSLPSPARGVPPPHSGSLAAVFGWVAYVPCSNSTIISCWLVATGAVLSVSGFLLSHSGVDPSKGPPQTTPLEPSIGLSLPGKFGEGTFALWILSRAWLSVHRSRTATPTALPTVNKRSDLAPRLALAALSTHYPPQSIPGYCR
jgi:hypothetical protein